MLFTGTRDDVFLTLYAVPSRSKVNVVLCIPEERNRLYVALIRVASVEMFFGMVLMGYQGGNNRMRARKRVV
jgi:hypothetical protein